MNRLLVPMLLILTAPLFLSGCAGNPGKGSPAAALSVSPGAPVANSKAERNKAIRAACGNIRVRDENWQLRLADELMRIDPVEYPTVYEALSDGAAARDAVRICRGEYQPQAVPT